MKKLIITYGVIAGLIVTAMLVITFSNPEHEIGSMEYLGYATMILAFATIFFAVRSYRDKFLEGYIDFWSALKIGLGITLVASVLYVVSWMIISNTIAEDFMSEYYQQSVEKLKASDLSEQEINNKIAEMDHFQELYKNPAIKIGITFLEIFPVGLVVSLISAMILKKKRLTEKL